jgi:type I restriction enzyme S subunit
MIADLKPYPVMKDSGVPWMGELPEHWELERAKWLFRKMDRPVRDADQVVTCFRDGIVTLRANRRVRGFTESLKEIGYQGIRRGDLVIHAMDAFAGAVGVADSDGKGTPVYSVCQPEPAANARFYAFLVREMARSQWIVALTKGIRERSTDFRFDGFASQPVPLPAPSEQSAIVRFLNHADRRIRRYISTKQKLIKLLEEQKQAIIYRAVTRGLNPNVRLKPSGVEWLGDIPQHWRIVRNMALFAHRVEAGVAGLPVLQVSLRSGITSEELDQFGRPKKLIADPTKYKRIYRGDIAYNTMRMWQGAVGVSPSDGLVSPAYVVLSSRGGTCPDFYDLVFHTDIYKQQVNRQSTGIVSDRNRLYWDSFKQMANVAMPWSEQEAIVAFIRSEASGLNITRSRLEAEIKLLREYRTRLIADVVTGKLDVREAATKLPEEADESEPLDEAGVLAECEEAEENENLDAVPEEAEA